MHHAEPSLFLFALAGVSAHLGIKAVVAPRTSYGVRALDTGEAQGVATMGATAEDVGPAIANANAEAGKGAENKTEEGLESLVFLSSGQVLVGHGAPDGVEEKGEGEKKHGPKPKDHSQEISGEAQKNEKSIESIYAVAIGEKAAYPRKKGLVSEGMHGRPFVFIFSFLWEEDAQRAPVR